MATEVDASGFNVIQPSLVRREVEIEVVGQEPAGKFVERKHLVTDAFEYPRNGSDPGLVLIINQEEFLTETERKGTRRDVNEIVLCFQRQGFNIRPDHIINDATTDEIKNKLKEVAESDLSEKNSLIIFFLSHGRLGDNLRTFDGGISTYEIWKNFSQCEHLKNKPKMFVFQACKGDNFSTTLNPPTDFKPSQIVQYGTFSPTYMGPDMLVVYSTIEGNVSFRSLLTGSWFIQELCKNFAAYGKRDDVVSLITRTTKCVSGNYFHTEDRNHKKQMPVYMSTLSKKFYLNRNKDRAMVLMYRSYYEDILKQVEEIKEQVEKLHSKQA